MNAFYIFAFIVRILTGEELNITQEKRKVLRKINQGELVMIYKGECKGDCETILNKLSKISSRVKLFNTDEDKGALEIVEDLNKKNVLNYPFVFYEKRYLPDNADEKLKKILDAILIDESTIISSKLK